MSSTSAPACQPTRHHLFSGRRGEPETSIWTFGPLSTFLTECGYQGICCWGEYIDDPKLGRSATVELLGNAAGHFCIVTNFGTASVPPTVIEASDVLNLSRAVGELRPLFQLLGVMK
jgi:hypothetical protein